MKVGDLVKHTPETDSWLSKLFIEPDFKSGLIIEEAQTNTEQHFWIVFGTKKGWYIESELTLLEY
jgi:hypothetical protein